MLITDILMLITASAPDSLLLRKNQLHILHRSLLSHHCTVGADLLQIPIGLFGKIVNAFVFCAIEHDTRRVHLLGITTHPTEAWIANAIRCATMDGEPLAPRKYWILDNDTKFGPQTRAVLGKRLVQTCLHAPDMNAFIERFFRSIQDECLNHIVCLSEGHLRHAVTEYLRHYNAERPHQGKGNRLLIPAAQAEPPGQKVVTTTTLGPIRCVTRCRGAIRHYYRDAA